MLRPLLLSLLALSAPLAFAQPYTIPVVVHVLWASPSQNVTDEQVLAQLDLMEQAYNSVSTQPVEPPYDVLAANMGISFCLASIAPDGTATTGIEHIQTPLALEGGTPGSYLDQWPPEQYLNIWVVGQMAFGAYFGSLSPAEADSDPGRDGVMVTYNDINLDATAWTMIFQTGRYLDLKLLWQDPIGDGPCGDDGVADTPPCAPFYACAIDSTDACTDQQPLMAQNYMTYAFCSAMFTYGQKDRVQAALNSAVAQRNNLWTPANLALTGCGAVNTMELQAEAEDLQVTPMSVPGQWSLHLPRTGSWRVTAFTSTGQQAGHWQATSDKMVIDLHDAASGLYVLRAVNTQGERYAAQVAQP